MGEIPTGALGWYAPSIAQKFQRRIDDRTAEGVLLTSGAIVDPGLVRLTMLRLTITVAER